VTDGNRNKLREYLENEGIPSMVYYPVPLHMQKAYSHLGYGTDDFPVTTELTNQVLSLPLHTELNNEQLEYITGCIRSQFK
jgi:dTDP-4-amino-4,6-dideoxygalactose transaminase